MKNRKIELNSNKKSTILKKSLPSLTGEEFVTQKCLQGHDVRILCFYEVDKLCTTIYADFSDETLIAENHIENPVKTAFGNNRFPDWADFQTFLQDRCIPKERAGLREYLESLGLAEYDALEIIKKTKGHMAEDQQWLEIKLPQFHKKA